MPNRVQLKRSKGWKMPADTVKIDRTTRWGNPFTPQEHGSIAAAVALYGQWMVGSAAAPDGKLPPAADDIRQALRGKNLACWCPLDGPCHADMLLKIANDD